MTVLFPLLLSLCCALLIVCVVAESDVHVPVLPTTPDHLDPLVQVLAFAPDSTHYDLDHPDDGDGMKALGHVGLHFINDRQVYGFTPYLMLSNRTEMVELLLSGSSIVGKVADDAAVFADAAGTEHGMSMLFIDMVVDATRARELYARVREDASRSQPDSTLVYAFPPEAPRVFREVDFSACDDSWNSTCFNCATYVEHVVSAVDLMPFTSGMMDRTIDMYARLSSARCGCFVRGQLAPRSSCAPHHVYAHCNYVEPLLNHHHDVDEL